MSRDGPFALDSADDGRLVGFISGARRRLVVLAPGLSLPVAQAIAERWQSLGTAAVNVILDVSPHVCRLGYGRFEALKLLEQTAADLGTTLNRHPDVRIGLVIADEATLVYSPTPLLIEAGPQQQVAAPNAIRLGPPPAALVRDLGLGPAGVREQTVGLDKAECALITQVEADLARNPPQKFDVARQVQVFNAYFQFVEFELRGTHLDRKTVPIPPVLMGVADPATQRQLRASFRIVAPDDRLSGKYLHEVKRMVAGRYLRHIPEHGAIILRKAKDAFLKEVQQLEKEVAGFRESAQRQLQAAMDKNRAALVEALLPALKRTPPEQWRPLNGDPDPHRLRQLLERELGSAFGRAEHLIGHMHVRTVFKDVTYELLTDDAFMAKARQAVPEMKSLHEEYAAARRAARSAVPTAESGPEFERDA